MGVDWDHVNPILTRWLERQEKEKERRRARARDVVIDIDDDDDDAGVEIVQQQQQQQQKVPGVLGGIQDVASEPLSDDDEPSPPPVTKRKRLPRKAKNKNPDTRIQGDEEGPSKKRRKKHDEAIECSICMVNKRTMAFGPCGHIYCCPDCARKLGKDGKEITCMLCDTIVKSTLRVFY